jgi:hypothetical protein
VTPKDFAKLYWENSTYFFEPEPSVLPDFLLPLEWQKMRVAKYRLGKSTVCNDLWDDIKTRLPNVVQVRVRFAGKGIWDLSLTPGQAYQHFHYPFVGKGTPEQAQIATQLVYRYHKVKNTPEEFNQKDFIGLDCNGFVGNYIRRAIKNEWWWASPRNDWDPGPTTLINGLFEFQGQQNYITDMEELKSEDTYILGYCADDGSILDPGKGAAWGHVMITEPRTLKKAGDGVIMEVVESCGGKGLRASPYEFLSASKQPHGTVFNVRRWGHIMPVRITRLDFERMKKADHAPAPPQQSHQKPKKKK